MEINEILASNIFNIGRLIKEKIRSSDCLNDFTYLEFEILKFIERERETTMKSITDYLHIKPPSATPVINKLVDSGNIKRIQKSDDKRVIHIELTSKGLGLLQKKYKNIRKAVETFFSKLSDKDKRELIKILEKISYEKNK